MALTLTLAPTLTLALALALTLAPTMTLVNPSFNQKEVVREKLARRYGSWRDKVSRP